MSVLLHVSDPHFGTEQPPVVAALAALAARLRPDLIVLTGDVTQRARAPQFAAARAFFDALGAPLLAIPGNHDIPLFDVTARLLRPYAGYRAAFGDDLEPVHASPELLVVGVNTTRPRRHKNGEVSAAQVDRVARRLRQAQPGQLRVVAVHQPLAVLYDEDRPDVLRGCAAAQRAWAEAGADVVVGGHIHRPYVKSVAGTARPLWAVQAGTAVSWRVRPGIPNSVNVLRWGAGAPAGACVVEQWDCPAGAGGFAAGAVTTLSPAR